MKHNFLEFDDVGIRKTPITNREYLIFLCWNIDVYGYSYPDKINSFLPIMKNAKPNSSRTKENSRTKKIDLDYQFILNNIDDTIFQSYTLNPKYLDYPVIGLSKNQIFEILKWLNNRYNEYLLINRGILNFNPHQRDEDCWVLESYLTDQYQGDVRKNIPDHISGEERAPRWGELPFLATFRLPYNSELQMIQENIEESFKLREYKFNNKNFLTVWDDFYLKELNDQVIFNLRRGIKLQFFMPKIDFDADSLELQIVSISNNDYQELKYFDEQNDEEKDIYGYRDFLILGENIEGRPISGIFKEIKNGNDKVNLISWVVFNKIITL